MTLKGLASRGLAWMVVAFCVYAVLRVPVESGTVVLQLISLFAAGMQQVAQFFNAILTGVA